MNNRVSLMDRTESQVEVIDLRHYWRLLMQNKWRIIGFALVITLLTAVMTLSMPSIYRSSATVLIESQEAKVLSIEEVYGVNTTNKEYYLTQFEILKSQDLAEQVVTRLGLTSNPLFDPRQAEEFNWRNLIPGTTASAPAEPPLSEGAVFAAVVGQFRQSLSIEPIPNTQLVKIHFESTDPALAALVANTMADVYIESHLEAKLGLTRKAASWLGERLGDLSDTLKASEARLQEYREQAQMVDVQGVQTLDAEELQQTTERYVETKRIRTRAETIYKQVQALGSNPSAEQLLAIPSILGHELVSKLKQAQVETERKVLELSERYGPKHPKMIAAQTDAAAARDQLRRQVVRVASGIEADYRTALQVESVLEQQLGQTKGRLQDLNRKGFRLKELEREVETNRQMYDMFLTRAKETDEAGGMQAAHARVIDVARPAGVPIKPDKKLLVVLAALVSGMFAVAVVLLLDMLNNTVRTPEDVEEKLHTSLLGFLPLIKTRRSDNALEGFLSQPRSQFAEAVRTIRTGVMLTGLDKPNKLVVVTSAVSDEGKSTVALNLAEAMGQMERVLLIDADMRCPAIAATLGLSATTPGLSNLVAGTADFKDCVQKLKHTTVDVLTSGVVPPNPLELLSSRRFAAALAKMADHYDRIVIDSAPVHAVSDVLVLAGLADAVIYVVRSDSTPTPLAAKSLRRLRDARAPVIGVVLNMVDLDKASGYSDYYAHYHANSGGYTDPA